MKAVSTLISAILLMAVVIAASSLLLAGLKPGVKNLQDSVIIEQMKDTLSTVDGMVRGVASESEGSKRTVAVKISRGELTINSSSDSIAYAIETSSGSIAPRTLVHSGNLIIGAGLGAAGYEGNYTHGGNFPAYVLENSHLAAYFRPVGSPQSQTAIQTGGILLGIYQKDLGLWKDGPGLLDAAVDGMPSSKSGTGYTALASSGSGLPSSTVMAYINSSYAQYYINFTLESDTDFLEISGGLA